jgi:hypothetical protein
MMHGDQSFEGIGLLEVSFYTLKNAETNIIIAERKNSARVERPEC